MIDSDLDLYALRAFATLVSEKRFTKAARALGLEQSTLSRQVQKLEQGLGAKLLVRTPEGVVMTEAGRVLLESYNQIRTVVDRTVSQLSKLSEHGTIRIGAIESVATYFLPDLLYSFRKAHNQLRVSLLHGFSDELEALLLRGELDLAVVSGNAKNDGITSTLLHEEDYILAVPLGHRFANRQSLSIAKLQGEPWVIPPTCRAMSAVEEGLAAVGVEPRLSFRAHNLVSTITAVASGHGLAMVPRVVAQHEKNSRVVFVKVQDFPLFRRIYLLHRGKDTLTSVAYDFCAALRRNFKKMFAKT